MAREDTLYMPQPDETQAGPMTAKAQPQQATLYQWISKQGSGRPAASPTSNPPAGEIRTETDRENRAG